MLDFLENSGGESDGGSLSKLYKSHPEVKSAISNAGGLRKFCGTHVGIEFVPHVGALGGVVRLEEQKKKASCSGLEKPGASTGPPFALDFQVELGAWVSRCA